MGLPKTGTELLVSVAASRAYFRLRGRADYGISQSTRGKAMAERKVFQDSVTPLPDTPGPGPRGLMVAAAEPETANEEMTVLFSLDIPAAKTADLEERVARGEVVSPDELQQNYAPNAPADRDKLVKWLK